MSLDRGATMSGSNRGIHRHREIQHLDIARYGAIDKVITINWDTMDRTHKFHEVRVLLINSWCNTVTFKSDARAGDLRVTPDMMIYVPKCNFRNYV